VEPAAAFADSSGAARKVKSIEAETHRLRSFAFFILGVVTGLLGLSFSVATTLKVIARQLGEAILRGMNR